MSSAHDLVLQTYCDTPPLVEFIRYTRREYFVVSSGYCCPVFPIGVGVPPGIVGGSGVSSRKRVAAAPFMLPVNTPLATLGFTNCPATVVSVPQVHQPTSVRWLMSQGSWNMSQR